MGLPPKPPSLYSLHSFLALSFTQTFFVLKMLIVTGFERTSLPRTQQEDTLFTITR